jgi:hypothetical protein
MNQQTDCPRFEGCNATLCPLADNLRHLIWYPDEDICTAKRFQTLPSVEKQKAIAKINAPNDRYFSVEMLGAVRQVRKGIEGISPDQSLEQAKKAERKWIMEKRSGRVIANQNSKRCQVTRAKRTDLVAVSNKAKGDEK